MRASGGIALDQTAVSTVVQGTARMTLKSVPEPLVNLSLYGDASSRSIKPWGNLHSWGSESLVLPLTDVRESLQLVQDTTLHGMVNRDKSQGTNWVAGLDENVST